MNTELDADFPARSRQLAEECFRKDFLNCAEAVFKGVLGAAGRDCPLAVLRLASAFGRGMGGAGCTCGALIGGQMALGTFFGRTSERGFTSEQCAGAAKELHDRFKAENRATCCRILHKGLPYGTPEQFESCCGRAALAAELTAAVIWKFLAAPPVEDGADFRPIYLK